MSTDNRHHALTISLLYATLGSLWILGSDWLLRSLVSDPNTRAIIQTYKGSLFVSITALLLFGLLIGCFNVRTRKQAQEQSAATEDLRDSEVRHRLLFEHNPLPMCVYAVDSARFLAVNEAAVRHYGYSRQEFLAMTIADICPPQEQERYASADAACNLARHRAKDGREMLVETHGFDLEFQARPARLVMALDMTERKRNEAHIHQLAHYDLVTGLPNLNLLRERLADAIARAEPEQGQVGVLFLDLDRFKNINDSLGHHRGDYLLRAVADRLSAVRREDDTVARIGGDTFVVLMPSLRDPEEACLVADRLFATLSPPFELEGHSLTITPSLGISLYPGDGEGYETLIRNAEAAMYHAKALGRNNYQFYRAEMNARALEALSLESELRQSLEQGEFVLHYQGQYGIDGRSLIGAESLIRWPHPKHGLLPPGDFIPIAEERGLIGALGEWTLRETCRQLGEWRAQGYELVPVAVNLSAPQFLDPLLPSKIAALLDEFALPADLLHLEITESMLMQESEAALVAMNTLAAMGIRFALDDFGTGYSSLAYLRRFRLHYLKIDRSFIAELDESRDAVAIVETIIALGKSLGLTVIAEGVESERQHAILRELGCEQLQGLLLGRPKPAEGFAERLSEATPA